MSEKPEPNKKSKLSSLIDKIKEEKSGIQIIVHYSENNWETNEELNLILDEETTIKELIETCKKKLSNKPNVDKNNFNVMIFKKKKKIPNVEYPICNSISKVKDYGKSHFCLVDADNTEPIKEPQIEKIQKQKEQIKNENGGKKSEEIKMNEKNDNNKNNKNNNRIKDYNKGNNENAKGKKNKKCVIF